MHDFRYKCVEEYVLLDEEGKIVTTDVNIDPNVAQSNKEHYVEPATKRSNIFSSKNTFSSMKNKIGAFESRTTTAGPKTTTTTKEAPAAVKLTSTVPPVIDTTIPGQRTTIKEVGLSPEGLNIQKIPLSTSDDSASSEKDFIG